MYTLHTCTLTLRLQVSFFDILVPTIDTQRYGYLMEKLLEVRRSVLFTGTTGVGKVSGRYQAVGLGGAYMYM